MNSSRWIALLAATWLAGCATVLSDCPPIREYPLEFQTRAAAELESLPPDSAVAEMIQDYGQLRDRIRKCRGP